MLRQVVVYRRDHLGGFDDEKMEMEQFRHIVTGIINKWKDLNKEISYIYSLFLIILLSQKCVRIDVKCMKQYTFKYQ